MGLNTNPKRSGPTSTPAADLVGVIERLASQVEQLEAAAIRGLPPGYRFEIDGSGPLVRDTATGAAARLAWEPSNMNSETP